jgi:hypothetical protein
MKPSRRLNQPITVVVVKGGLTGLTHKREVNIQAALIIDKGSITNAV